jgi:predicted RNA-binding Zn ribbon-like protein
MSAVHDARRPPTSREPCWRSAALALVNSEYWYGRGAAGIEDQLETPGWLTSYLDAWKLTPEKGPSDHDRRSLVALRALLRRLVTALHERREIEPDLEVLRPYIELSAVRRRLALPDLRMELEPVRRDWDWVLGEIAASFVELLAAGGRERIKLCANDECGWAFYDESKNQRRRWCDMQICGNITKVRRFRARTRSLPPAER